MSYGGNMSNIGKKGKIDKKKFPKKFETQSNIGKVGKIDKKKFPKKFETPSKIGKIGKRGKIAEVNILSN